VKSDRGRATGRDGVEADFVHLRIQQLAKKGRMRGLEPDPYRSEGWGNEANLLVVVHLADFGFGLVPELGAGDEEASDELLPNHGPGKSSNALGYQEAINGPLRHSVELSKGKDFARWVPWDLLHGHRGRGQGRGGHRSVT
jgi:hypothetical protein